MDDYGVHCKKTTGARRHSLHRKGSARPEKKQGWNPQAVPSGAGTSGNRNKKALAVGKVTPPNRNETGQGDEVGKWLRGRPTALDPKGRFSKEGGSRSSGWAGGVKGRCAGISPSDLGRRKKNVAF